MHTSLPQSASGTTNRLAHQVSKKQKKEESLFYSTLPFLSGLFISILNPAAPRVKIARILGTTRKPSYEF